LPRQSILIIEDDEDIQRMLTYQLVKNGFNVSCADSGEDGLELLAGESFDCVILDIMLPSMDGLEVCSRIRKDKDTASIPILMLTARSEEEDMITGFDSGADDYVTKPFSPKVLMARIQVLLRKRRQSTKSAGSDSRLDAGSGLKVDLDGFSATLNGRPLPLTATEFKILSLLAKQPGRVFSRQQIIDDVMGYGYVVSTRAVDVQIHGLRKKLGPAGALIETVRSIGYRFKGGG